MSASIGLSASGLACSYNLRQTLVPSLWPCHLPPNIESRGRKLWDGWSHSWGSYCKGRGKMICQERGPFGYHTLLLISREGGDGAIRGQENRKHVQEGHTHQQKKTDFKAITTSKEKILCFLICQAQEN